MPDIFNNPEPLSDAELHHIEKTAKLAVAGTIDWHDGPMVLRIIERLRKAEERLTLVTRIKPNDSCPRCYGSGHLRDSFEDSGYHDCPCTYDPIKSWFPPKA